MDDNFLEKLLQNRCQCREPEDYTSLTMKDRPWDDRPVFWKTKNW